MKRITTIAAIAAALAPVHVVHAQWIQKPQTGSMQEMLPDRTIVAGQAGLSPQMSAELIDGDRNAKQGRALVRVETGGIHLVDPASVNRVPRLDQGHIRYQLDSGTPVDTTTREMDFRNLGPGKHEIRVALVGNDNQLFGRETTLTVHIPKSK